MKILENVKKFAGPVSGVAASIIALGWSVTKVTEAITECNAPVDDEVDAVDADASLADEVAAEEEAPVEE